ncbi:hypothetical protein GALL_118490 [mine drainage metagenome]|jgi:hypothetical protein|uniref:Uncharacterized protein n=1 Tax=mine drainage metagenome TaxID=410659 RepID=A0A1J5SWS6_9ZZZZ
MENKINSAKRKQPKNIRLFMPLFLDDEDVLSSGVLNIELSQILNGNLLYGDDAKREGLADAQSWAQKHKKIIRVLDVNVALTGDVHGQSRPFESDLLDGKIGMLRIEKHSTKADLTEAIDSCIESYAKIIYPRLKKQGMDEWLELDPSLAHALFDRYPVGLVIVNSHVPYSKRIFSVGVIKKEGWKKRISANLLYYNKVKVNLIE